MSKVWYKSWNKFWIKLWRENKYLLRPYLVILAIYLVGILAIILAGVHYADDVARTNYGYAGWSGFSRYLSTVLAHGLHADNYLTNIYPLPQLLAVVMLALASLFFICIVSGKEVFKKEWTRWIWLVVAVVPLGLSPYMLECLSYQYDAPYMALSVLFAVIPLLFRSGSKLWYSIAIIVGTLVVCMTYQASIGIFPMLVIFVAMKNWSQNKKLENKENVKFVLWSAGIFLLSVVVFQKFLMTPRDAYASNSLPGIGELVPAFFAHLGQYFGLVVGDFRMLWKVLIIAMAVMFVVIFVMRSRKNKVVAGMVAVIGTLVMVVMTLAFYAVLDKPLYAPRAMYAVGAFVALIGVYIVWGAGSGWWSRTPVVVLSFCFVVFGFTYGNALNEQNIYRNSRADMIIADINSLKVMQTEGLKIIQVDGQIGLSPVILHMPFNDYQILYRLLMPSFNKNIPWMAYKITQQSGLDKLHYQPEVDLKERNLPLLKETVLYNIYGDKDGILVELKEKLPYEVLF